MNESKIAVVGAFKIEIEKLGEALKDKGEIQKTGFLTSVTGTLADRTVLVGTTGLGKVRAAAATQAVISLFQPRLILFCGTAGALSKEVGALDLVVADRLCQHDVMEKETAWIEVEDALVDRLHVAAKEISTVFCGPLITGDRPVLDRRQKKELAGRHRALAVDMEAAAGAAVAVANRVPVAVIKAITDGADKKGVEDFKRNVKAGAALAQEVIMAFLGS